MLERITDEDSFEYWLSYMDQAIDNFIGEIGGNYTEILDFSKDSLGALEEWLLHRYPKIEASRPADQAPILDGASRYLGEALRRNLGGKWIIEFKDSKNAFYGLPQISGMVGQTSQICPLALVTASLDRRSGSFFCEFMRVILRSRFYRAVVWRILEFRGPN